MLRRVFLVAAALASLSSLASAAPTMIAGHHVLEANTPGQIVPITVSGVAGDVFIGLDLYLSVADGTLGPVITNVDINSPGLVFAGNNNGISDFGPPYEAPSREVVAITTTVSGTVGPNGTLAFIELDTTGIAPGVYAFSLTSPLFGPSDLPPFSAPDTNLIDGTLTVVPEPSTVVLGGLAGLGLALAAYRRRAARTS